MYLWSILVYLWSILVYRWSTLVYLWSTLVYLWSTLVYLWSILVYLWSILAYLLWSSVDPLIISENYFGRVSCHLEILPSEQLQIFVIITQSVRLKYQALIVFLAKMTSDTFLNILHEETVKLFLCLRQCCRWVVILFEYSFRGFMCYCSSTVYRGWCLPLLIMNTGRTF